MKHLLTSYNTTLIFCPVVGVLTVKEIHTTTSVTCPAALTCPKSCSLGYKCGADGCPICECLIEVHTGKVYTSLTTVAFSCSI